MSGPAPPARSRLAPLPPTARALPLTRRALAGGLLAALARPPRAAAQPDRVDQVVREAMDERHIPGVSLAVVKDGATIKSAAYGRMRLAPDEPAAPTTIYKLDSVTKQFTASGVMLLVQAGRVCLDQPVRTYLPNAPGSWDAITIRNLLTHTSGLAHDPPSGYAVLDTDRVLTAESKRAMWSPFRLTDGRWHPYGFAWAVRELPGGKVVFHNGAGDGFNNAFYRFLDARLTVIVLTNLNPSRRHGSHADALARRIAALYDPALVFPERHHPPLNQPS